MKAGNLSLIAAINHACDTLGLYRAELARILGLNCADVSDSRYLESLLESNTAVRNRAESFSHFYQLLETAFNNDTVQMINWFRRDNAGLGTTPFLAMIDHGKLDDVMDVLQQVTMNHAEQRQE